MLLSRQYNLYTTMGKVSRVHFAKNPDTPGFVLAKRIIIGTPGFALPNPMAPGLILQDEPATPCLGSFCQMIQSLRSRVRSAKSEPSCGGFVLPNSSANHHPLTAPRPPPTHAPTRKGSRVTLGGTWERAVLLQEPVAQLVEHVTFNHGVLGSSPSGLTQSQLRHSIPPNESVKG
jgi:hypothetical protein